MADYQKAFSKGSNPTKFSPEKRIQRGWCVEYITHYDGDAHGGLDGESVTYQRRFFSEARRAETWAQLMRCMEPCPVVAGDIAIHDAIFKSKTNKWKIADDRHTEWIDVGTGDKY